MNRKLTKIKIASHLLFVLLLIFTSCSSNQKSDPPQAENKEETSPYRTAQIEVEDSIFTIPNYINTNIHCLKKAPFSQPKTLKPTIVTGYFSEYSSIHFFTIITPKQIYFETFNENGTPKPDLIFYVDDIKFSEYQMIWDYFKEVNTHQDLKYTHDSGQHLMIKDQVINDFGKKWEGDKYPLTKLESTWLVKRHLELFGQIANSEAEFKEELLKPVFYNLCSYENELNHWTKLYPELQDHVLKY
jgi:hypothetical protein